MQSIPDERSGHAYPPLSEKHGTPSGSVTSENRPRKSGPSAVSGVALDLLKEADRPRAILAGRAEPMGVRHGLILVSRPERFALPDQLNDGDFHESKTAVKTNRTISSVPLSLGLVRAVPACPFPVWHGLALLESLVHLVLRVMFTTGLSEILVDLLPCRRSSVANHLENEPCRCRSSFPTGLLHRPLEMGGFGRRLVAASQQLPRQPAIPA